MGGEADLLFLHRSPLRNGAVRSKKDLAGRLVSRAKAKISHKWGQFQVQIPDDLMKFCGVQVNQLGSNKINSFNLLMCGVY